MTEHERRILITCLVGVNALLHDAMQHRIDEGTEDARSFKGLEAAANVMQSMNQMIATMAERDARNN